MTFRSFDRFGVDPYYVFSFPSLFPSLFPSHRLPPFDATLLKAWKAVGGCSSNGSLVVGILASNGPSSVASTSCKSCYDLLLSLNPVFPTVLRNLGLHSETSSGHVFGTLSF